jgi:hypothetical protein
MEPLDYFEKLADLARREPVPEIGVGGVLARIRGRPRMSLLPLWIYAGWLAPTAAAVLFLAIRVWASIAAWLSSVYWAGPMDNFLSPLKLVVP